jgi:membrane protein implicated in regulation of membrane protease activity
VVKSKVRWWESARKLGFVGTVAATLVAAAFLAAFGRFPVDGWAMGLWDVLFYRVPVPSIVLAGMIVLLLMAGVGVLKRAAVPARPPKLEYWQDVFLGVKWPCQAAVEASGRSALKLINAASAHTARHECQAPNQ